MGGVGIGLAAAAALLVGMFLWRGRGRSTPRTNVSHEQEILADQLAGMDARQDAILAATAAAATATEAEAAVIEKTAVEASTQSMAADLAALDEVIGG